MVCVFLHTVMTLEDLKELSNWALRASQWQRVMLSRDILRTLDDKTRIWQPTKDTHVGSIKWEDADKKANGECETWMRWRLKPSKRNPGAEKRFEKTFLVDGNRNPISAVIDISRMFHKQGKLNNLYHINIPLLEDLDNETEKTISYSSKLFWARVKEEGLSPQHIKGHSLRILGASAFANLPDRESSTAGFLPFWASCAR